MLTIIANAGKTVLNFGYMLFVAPAVPATAIVRYLITIVAMLLASYLVYRVYFKLGKHGIGFFEGIKMWYNDYVKRCIFNTIMNYVVGSVANTGMAWAAY